MPYREFLWLWMQADRLEAERDIRQLELLVCAQGQEGMEQMFTHLRQLRGVTEVYMAESPKVVEINTDDGALDPDFNRQALRALKARHGV